MSQHHGSMVEDQVSVLSAWTVETSVQLETTAGVVTLACYGEQSPPRLSSWLDPEQKGDLHGRHGPSLNALLMKEFRSAFGLDPQFGVAEVERVAMGPGLGYQFGAASDPGEAFAALLARFVRGNTSLSPGDHAAAEDALASFPVVTFGSPPQGVNPLASVISHAPFVAAVGTASWHDQPQLAVAAGATALVFWFVKPSARVLRRSMAERIADRLSTKMKDSDEA